jgi:hypothetical protein
MACPQAADGGMASWMWRAAVNILNKQLRTADKGWSSSLGVGRGANKFSLQKLKQSYEPFHKKAAEDEFK